jgi:hypothetical protein
MDNEAQINAIYDKFNAYAMLTKGQNFTIARFNKLMVSRTTAHAITISSRDPVRVKFNKSRVVIPTAGRRDFIDRDQNLRDWFEEWITSGEADRHEGYEYSLDNGAAAAIQPPAPNPQPNQEEELRRTIARLEADLAEREADRNLFQERLRRTAEEVEQRVAQSAETIQRNALQQLQEERAASALREQQLQDERAAGALREQQLQDERAANARREQQLRDERATNARTESQLREAHRAILTTLADTTDNFRRLRLSNPDAIPQATTPEVPLPRVGGRRRREDEEDSLAETAARFERSTVRRFVRSVRQVPVLGIIANRIVTSIVGELADVSTLPLGNGN